MLHPVEASSTSSALMDQDLDLGLEDLLGSLIRDTGEECNCVQTPFTCCKHIYKQLSLKVAVIPTGATMSVKNVRKKLKVHLQKR